MSADVELDVGWHRSLFAGTVVDDSTTSHVRYRFLEIVRPKCHNSQSASSTDFRHVCGHYCVFYIIILYSQTENYIISLVSLLLEPLPCLSVQKNLVMHRSPI